MLSPSALFNSLSDNGWQEPAPKLELLPVARYGPKHKIEFESARLMLALSDILRRMALIRRALGELGLGSSL